MRAAIRASLLRTGEDLGLALRRALVGQVARRAVRGPAGIVSGDEAADDRARGRPARVDGGGITRDKSQGSRPERGKEGGTGRGQEAK